jgi:hypothetical protein
MVSWDAVAALALSLPETEEGLRFGNRTWFVAGKGFAWERPFSKADIRRFGDEVPPAGPILAVSVDDLAEKEAVLQANPVVFFSIEHFANYPAVLIQLHLVRKPVLRDALVDAWLAAAPKRLADQHAPALLRRR